MIVCIPLSCYQSDPVDEDVDEDALLASDTEADTEEVSI